MECFRSAQSWRRHLARSVCRVMVACLLLLNTFTSAFFVNSSPKTKQITCYTCKNHTHNWQCNKVAVDRPCPRDTSFCETQHTLDPRSGASLFVIKACVSQCQLRVGCSTNGNRNKCISCCGASYCNKESPQNATHALELSASVISRASPASTRQTSLLSSLAVTSAATLAWLLAS